MTTKASQFRFHHWWPADGDIADAATVLLSREHMLEMLACFPDVGALKDIRYAMFGCSEICFQQGEELPFRKSQ